jgi:hypothetical protein
MAKRRPPPRIPLPFGMRFDHVGPLNAEVHRIFTGLYPGNGGEALARLLHSDEPLDPHTGAVLARALDEAIAGNSNAFRLEYRAPSDGFRSWQEYADSAAKWQAIADEYERLATSEGLGKQRAYQRIIDDGLAKSDRSIDEARKYAREALMKVRKCDEG